MLEELENSIKAYAWGSHSAIATLLGHPAPSAEPQAELWIGAHPLGPSRFRRSGRTLLSAIMERPTALLGTEVEASYGAKLPFLLKVLAAASPLSLQAHPSVAQAQAGFAADEARGIPLEAPERNYKDRNHKPELLCALSDFTALCGFRAVPATLSLCDSLGVAELASQLEPLRSSPDQHGIERVFSHLMRLAPLVGARLAEQVTEACAKSRSSEFASEHAWGARIGAQYPGDVGSIIALMLNLVELKPGEAIYLPAGNLHAYLCGTGVEVMASSDNVLRGGLTSKHVNVPELLRVLDFRVLAAAPIRPVQCGAALVYPTPAREFELSRFELERNEPRVAVRGPELWLATSGTAWLASANDSVELGSGRACFVSADTGELALRGTAQVFRARVAHSA